MPDDRPLSAAMPRWLERTLNGIVACVIFSMMALIFADVFLRYFFNSPIVGSFEIVQFQLALAIFSALPLLSATDGHIVVGLFDGVFRGTIRRVQQVGVSLVSIAALGLIAWLVVLQGRTALRYDKVTGFLELPLAWLNFAMAVLAFVALMVQAALLYHRLRGRSAAL